jgi:carbon storage regulator
MLVLTRKAGEQIAIGPDIVVKVVEVRGDVVKLGIEAPAGVRIQRQEVLDAVAAANSEAAASAAPDLAALRALVAATEREKPKD